MPEPSKPIVCAELFKKGEDGSSGMGQAGGTNPSGQKIQDFEIKQPDLK